jgi:hypothetical protein
MSNSTLGVVTKVLTLVPFVVLLYFFDFARFGVVFSPSLRVFFVAAVALFAVGIMLKPRILRAALQLSSVSFAWGAFFLAFSVALYLYGPYSANLAWCRFESLYFLVISYFAFRIGTRILRVLSPLLLILALSFLPLGLFPASLERLVGVTVSWVYLVSFLVYTGLRAESARLPVLIAMTGLAAWQAALVTWLAANYLRFSQGFYLYALLPVPVLALLVPKVLAILRVPTAGSAGECPGHTTRGDGFCSTCGARVSAPKTPENVGSWGLLATGGVTALLLFASVPALVFIGGVPTYTTYTSQGYASSVIPPTPSGWQVNSTTLQEFPVSDLYAVVNVYVPLVHPETENYTVYYEVATSLPVSSIPNGGEVAGWNRTSNNFMQFGPYQGDVTTYTTAGRVMVSYHGRTQMSFVNDGTFQEYYVGLGFVRIFKNSNVTADASQFLGDITALWLPGVSTAVSYSTWTGFLGRTYDGAVFATPYLLVVSSIGVMSWLFVQASKRDDRLDRFLTLSSLQSQSSWSTLSLLLGRKNHAGTALGLASDEKQGGTHGAQEINASLESLEQQHLVKSTFTEAGSDLALVWRTVV